MDGSVEGLEASKVGDSFQLAQGKGKILNCFLRVVVGGKKEPWAGLGFTSKPHRRYVVCMLPFIWNLCKNLWENENTTQRTPVQTARLAFKGCQGRKVGPLNVQCAKGGDAL